MMIEEDIVDVTIDDSVPKRALDYFKQFKKDIHLDLKSNFDKTIFLSNNQKIETVNLHDCFGDTHHIMKMDCDNNQINNDKCTLYLSGAREPFQHIGNKKKRYIYQKIIKELQEKNNNINLQNLTIDIKLYINTHIELEVQQNLAEIGININVALKQKNSECNYLNKKSVWNNNRKKQS